MNSLHTSKSTMVLALINIVSGSRIIATQLPSLINVVSDLNRNGSNIYAAIQCIHHFHLSISVVTYNHPIQRSLSAIKNNNLQPQPHLTTSSTLQQLLSQQLKLSWKSCQLCQTEISCWTGLVLVGITRMPWHSYKHLEWMINVII